VKFHVGWRFLLLMLWFSLPAAAQDTAQQTGGMTIHVVQRGETLYDIARLYGLTVEDITAVNNLSNPENIRVGQRLLIPIPASSQPQTAGAQMTHTVQAGETLQSIAAEYNTTVEELARINQIANIDAIYAGQVLNITAGTGATDAQPRTPDPVNVVYTIQEGETLFRIATRFGVDVNAIATANNITDPTLIFAGQQIIIPNYIPPHFALDLPAPITALDVLPVLFVEGETGRVHLTTAESVIIGGTFLSQTLNFASENNGTQHTTLFGIPLGTPAGIYPFQLRLTTSAGTEVVTSINLQVSAGGYSVETIQLLDGLDNLLDPNVEQAELEILRRVMSPFTPERYFDGPMGLPAAATITSFFGVTRSYNGGEFNRTHYGTDFAGTPGTPVLAAAAGRVVMVDALNVRGRATIIDHGWGVYTGYWHQNDQYVQLGDQVTAGQVIGTIGSSGRVTGAHLHWELWVSGVPVNPMQWVSVSFP
jgi:murein DD-endopeptidase MepM/ murein hydrolase activator NlpD